MKPLGRKHQKASPGHQRCVTCHGPTKSGKARERSEAARRVLLDVILLDGESDAAPSLEDMARRAEGLLKGAK